MYSVIIVDDEAIICNGLKRYIDTYIEGFEAVAILTDGDEAIEYLKSSTPDVILTDINMINISGLDLCKYVWENKIDTEVIIISGYKEFEYVRQALKYNVSDYLLKPVKLNELSSVFTEIAERLKERRTVKDNAPDESLNKSDDTVIDKVKQYIAKNYASDISLETIADLLYFNPAYLSRIFKKSTGIRFVDYLTEIRINKAKELLKESHKKVYEIGTP